MRSLSRKMFHLPAMCRRVKSDFLQGPWQKSEGSWVFTGSDRLFECCWRKWLSGRCCRGGFELSSFGYSHQNGGQPSIKPTTLEGHGNNCQCPGYLFPVSYMYEIPLWQPAADRLILSILPAETREFWTCWELPCGNSSSPTLFELKGKLTSSALIGHAVLCIKEL